uniref:Protein kinase domain-containing protein n=1 Tax=Mola mola TaxID=94237 RepID=A0A3Q3XNI7_MOLML
KKIRCYDIGRAVGDGNFAVVRECRRRDNVQTLAVKIVERSKLIGREHMMQNELSLLGSLCHPRIVRLFAHHHTHTHSYLVMELVGGGDLFDAISEKGRFSESEAGLMVSDVSEALNYIHCKSIVHRDVKPENLLVSDVLKLGDFGLAMVVTEPVFTICGTPTYVAPEILCETGYGVAVDVWALGVILYILLCGFPPFRSKERDQEELFQLIKQGHFHFLSPYWDPISEARGLVTALLQPDPTMRLTAEQTWLHPWVTAMASICRQRALTDRAERSTADDAAEPDRIHKIAPSSVPEKMADKTLGHTNRQAESIQKELSTSSEATAGAQRPEFTPTGSPCSGSTQDPDYDPGSQLEITEQAGYSGTEEKSKEGMAGVPRQPWEEESRNAHWEKTQGGGAGEAGAQRATGQAKQNSKQKTSTMTNCVSLPILQLIGVGGGVKGQRSRSLKGQTFLNISQEGIDIQRRKCISVYIILFFFKLYFILLLFLFHPLI